MAITTMTDTPQRKSQRGAMFGFSWDQVSAFANSAYIVLLAATVVCSFALWRISVRSGREKDDELARYKEDAKVQIEATKNDAAKANDRAAQAIKAAADLGVTFTNLQGFVEGKEAEAVARLEEFRKSSADEKRRNAAVIADLTQSKDKLEQARIEATVAAESSQKTLADITKVLDAERAMRDQIQALVTPRKLSAEQVAKLIDSLRPLGKVPFDIFVAQDNDSIELMNVIRNALEISGWDLKRSNSILGLPFVNRPELGTIGIVAMRGIQIEIANKDKPELEKPALALFNTLASFGFNMGSARGLSDAELTAENKTAGVMHVFIGSK